MGICACKTTILCLQIIQTQIVLSPFLFILLIRIFKHFRYVTTSPIGPTVQ